MKKSNLDRINFLKEKHLTLWLDTRREIETELSEKQAMFCVCGRLATGLHECHCRKFQNKVDLKTIAKLKNI